MDVLNQCQAGQLVATMSMSCDLDEVQCQQVLQLQTSQIARRISEQITDEDDYEDLLEVLDEEEEYEYLDKPNAILGRDAISDGEEILKLLYGSLDKARDAAAQMSIPPDVDAEVAARLMTLSATLTLAAMARRNQQFQLSAASQDAAESDGRQGEGLIAMIVSAFVAGLMQALRQTVRPRRRRRKRNILSSIFGTGPKKRRRRRSRRRRRRRKSPTLNDLLGDILRG